MTSTRKKGWAWGAVEEGGEFWSGHGAFQALKVIKKGCSVNSQMCWLWAGTGEALEVVERIEQRAWGQLYLHLSGHLKAPPELWALGPASLGSSLCRAGMTGV